ncbi:DUF6327 family protein [Flavobacterium sp. NRK1]|uniref:DUF6327 family protein n=1 Tax=Flavobacterium sp. NRK1 TaxID=2954929 RepID=UPI002091F197|nr:DUF6327 family protein [Flavobacterium sp. NRK1]MCO6147628.1 DUF6327 family protein [Flavobacterium sp. NRK1]
MKLKVYNSYDEINRDLEILKVEKDLAYAKFKRSLDETKDSLQPMNMIGDTPKKVLHVLGSLSGPIKSAALTWIFKKIF